MRPQEHPSNGLPRRTFLLKCRENVIKACVSQVNLQLLFDVLLPITKTLITIILTPTPRELVPVLSLWLPHILSLIYSEVPDFLNIVVSSKFKRCKRFHVIACIAHVFERRQTKLNAQLSSIQRAGNPADSVVTSAKMQLAPPEVARSVVKPLFTWGDAKCRVNP
jgi:hypothetical protein